MYNPYANQPKQSGSFLDNPRDKIDLENNGVQSSHKPAQIY